MEDQGLDKRISPIFIKALESKKWDTTNCIIPEPFLLSAGMNLPERKGSPSDWPFSLKTIGELGKSMGLSEKDTEDPLRRDYIFSRGVQQASLVLTSQAYWRNSQATKTL